MSQRPVLVCKNAICINRKTKEEKEICEFHLDFDEVEFKTFFAEKGKKGTKTIKDPITGLKFESPAIEAKVHYFTQDYEYVIPLPLISEKFELDWMEPENIKSIFYSLDLDSFIKQGEERYHKDFWKEKLHNKTLLEKFKEVPIIDLLNKLKESKYKRMILNHEEINTLGDLQNNIENLANGFANPVVRGSFRSWLHNNIESEFNRFAIEEVKKDSSVIKIY